MPRLKAIHVQKLSRPDVGQSDACPNLRAILTKPIDWELVRQQYDQMVKYVTAVRLGTAETEAILRRFVRSNMSWTLALLRGSWNAFVRGKLAIFA
jgi:TnpA family transposase